MKSAITVWLFERVSVDVALAGDLLEEHAQGRSALWYWRQVLIAVCVGNWTAIRDHKELALRALATGSGVNSVWISLWTNFLHIALPLQPVISMESMASLSIILGTQVVTGWVVARFHRAHAIPMVFLFAVWMVLWFVAQNFAHLRMLTVDSISQPRFRAYLAWYVMPNFFVVLGLLLGGVLGARPRGRLTETDCN